MYPLVLDRKGPNKLIVNKFLCFIPTNFFHGEVIKIIFLKNWKSIGVIPGCNFPDLCFVSVNPA